MLGNILLGSYIPGDKKLGVFIAEVGPDLSLATGGLLIRSTAVFSSLPSTHERDPTRDLNISLEDENIIPPIIIGAYGNFDEFGTTLYGGISLSSTVTFTAPEIIATGYGPIYIDASFDFDIEFVDDNTVMWGKIGEVNFTPDQSNVTGKAPMEWKGYVFQIAKLGKYAYVYGETGITKMTPSGVYWGQETISKKGIKSKHSFCQTEDAHYFILSDNYFCKMTRDKGIIRLGYVEFMETLTEPVMMHDNYKDNIYISDVNNGYIYSINDDSMGKGESAITGVLYQDEDIRLFSSKTSTDLGTFTLCTDTFDLGTRKRKTIFNLEIMTDYEGLIEASIDFKNSKADSFVTIPWKMVNPDGKVEIPCECVDFRIRLRATISEAPITTTFNIEQIKVNGVVHGFSFLDTITMK